MDGRRREDDVADLTQPDEQDPGDLRICGFEDLRICHAPRAARLLFDFRLFDQHHRDVVLDWIDALARGALEARMVIHRRDAGMALGAHENLEQLWIDGHAWNI
jgi:hypothetical protein